MKNSKITLVVILFSSILYSQVTEFKLLPSDGATRDFFGDAVSISSEYVIIGSARDDDNGVNSGSAYIYRRSGHGWIEEQKITASDADELDLFGISVSISGNYLLVGAENDEANGFWSGSAYTFIKDSSGWIEEQKLTASDGAPEDIFGNTVSISGNYAIVGAYGDDDNGSGSGSAYIFERNDSNWIELQKLVPADGDQGDLFGITLSISGNYAIVGSIGDDDNGSSSGSAYIFKRNNSNWTEEQKLIASDGAVLDGFGLSVSIYGDYAMVGAARDDDVGSNSGSVYIFRRNGSSWIEEQKLTASDGEDSAYFGASVSISEDYAVVGAYLNHNSGIRSGSAYIFKRVGSIWIEDKKLIASDLNDSTYFGRSVSISNYQVVIGAPLDNDNGYWSGSAYIYTDFAVGVQVLSTETPTRFKLTLNYPNPFNPGTKISWQLPVGSHQTLKIYDVLGNEVATLVDEYRPAGVYEVEWSASGLPSGVYFYQLKAKEYLETKKMILMK